MGKKIILINGWVGNGKDTLADYLKNKHGYTKLWFSYPLKINVSKKYNIDYNLLLSQEGKKMKYKNTNQTLRELLIKEANIIKKNDDAYYANKMVEKIKRIKSEKIVISDWRFKTELNTLKKLLPTYSIKTIQIKRMDKPLFIDDSEFNLENFNFDYIINNSYDLHKLYNFVDENLDYFF